MNEPVDGDLHGCLLGGEVEHVDAAQRDGHLHVRQLLVPRLQWREITSRLGFFQLLSHLEFYPWQSGR